MNQISPDCLQIIFDFLDQQSLANLRVNKRLTYSINIYVKRFEREINYKILENICKNREVFSYLSIKDKFNEITHWNWGLQGACRGGHMDIIHLMIEKGANDWNWGLEYACLRGHMDIVKIMIEKGANNWNWGLYHACQGGHIDIVKIMIEKGADNWNWGLNCACRGGHMGIINLMLENGANNWNDGLYGACRGGHMGIINLMIEKGATDCFHCKKSMKEHIRN